MSTFLLLSILWLAAMPYMSHLLPQISPFYFESAGFVLAFALSLGIARCNCVQRLFVPLIDRISQVNHRAELEFFESNIKATKDSTGVLIFVSLLERRAVILADKAVSDKFPAETWNKIVNELLTKIHAGDIAGGFVTAIENCGKLLAEKFPIQAGDANELANDLLIKD